MKSNRILLLTNLILMNLIDFFMSNHFKLLRCIHASTRRAVHPPICPGADDIRIIGGDISGTFLYPLICTHTRASARTRARAQPHARMMSIRYRKPDDERLQNTLLRMHLHACAWMDALTHTLTDVRPKLRKSGRPMPMTRNCKKDIIAQSYTYTKVQPKFTW